MLFSLLCQNEIGNEQIKDQILKFNGFVTFYLPSCLAKHVQKKVENGYVCVVKKKKEIDMYIYSSDLNDFSCTRVSPPMFQPHNALLNRTLFTRMISVYIYVRK